MQRFESPESVVMARILGGVFSLLLFVASTVHADAPPKVQLVTSMGKITLELNQDKAPKTVANFIRYVQDGFYDGTIFHRVIDGFMIQGGGFTEKMERKEVRGTIPNEAENGLKNSAGTIAMARTSDPHSASSQFFINVADNKFLNHSEPTPRGWGYAVFGRVVDGMATVEKIKAVTTTQLGPYKDVPEQPVVIKSAKLLTE